MRAKRLRLSHLLARQGDVLCTACHAVEPVSPGHGTPLDSLMIGYQAAARRHSDCGQTVRRRAAPRWYRCGSRSMSLQCVLDERHSGEHRALLATGEALPPERPRRKG